MLERRTSSGYEASGRATLYTWSVVHVNDLPPFPERVPYVAALVDLEEGPRMMTNVVDCEFDELEGGMALEVVFEQVSDEPLVTVPVFRPGLTDPVSPCVTERSTPSSDWNFPFEAALHDVFPALHEAQNAWLSQIDSLRGARPQDARADPPGRAR